MIDVLFRAGVSEDALKEFSMMFKHFDKEKSGKLNHQEFKSCLRALGYDLPMVEEGQPDPEFDAILGAFVKLCIVNFNATRFVQDNHRLRAVYSYN